TLPEIQVRALRALVQELRASKRAATKMKLAPVPVPASAPAPARVSAPVSAPASAPVPARAACVEPGTAPPSLAWHGGRHIPASVRRAVFDRDDERCAYRDNRGERCRETFGLEVHHRHAHAL